MTFDDLSVRTGIALPALLRQLIANVPQALGSFSMRSAMPSSWATTMHLRTKGEAGEKKICMMK